MIFIMKIYAFFSKNISLDVYNNVYKDTNF